MKGGGGVSYNTVRAHLRAMPLVFLYFNEIKLFLMNPRESFKIMY